MSTHANRVKMTVTSVDATPSTGLGAITLNAASTGFRSFATAYSNANATVDILITEGTAWEIARNCTYTHSGTTVSRGTLESSSTGNAVAFTADAVVSVIATAAFGNSTENVLQTYIRGLLVTKYASGNTIDVSAGACYDPSSDKVITYAGATNISVGTLGASQWNQVYIYDNAGTATIQVINNADPPSTVYAGTARQGGTTITNKRWIGCFLTDGSSNIRPYVVTESADSQIVVNYTGDNNSSPFRVLSGGTQTTTFTEVSMAAVVPKYISAEVLAVATLQMYTGSGANMYMSNDGATINIGVILCPPAATGTPYFASIFYCPIDAATPSIYYRVGSASNPAYIDVSVYKAVR